MPGPILLYDGVCGLCNRLVRFVMRHDRDGSFRFAALQSTGAARILAGHGADPNDLDTVYVVINHDSPGEGLLSRSDSVVFVLKQLGGAWRVAAFLLLLLPRFVREAGYNFVARRRYRIFGRSETCAVPSVEERGRFLGW